MAYTIESRTVGTDAIFGFNPPALQGYWREGTSSSTNNIDQHASELYAGSDWSMILWQNSNDTLTLQVEGHVNDQTTDNLEGWDAMVIDGTTFNRSSATITTVFSASAAYYKIKTQWTWTGVSTSPFGATGRSITVSWRHNGFAPTTGAISLNQIHQEAGGSSGTQVSINDSDVRGKSWYARVAGSTPASGSTQDFADFYYPRLFGADQGQTSYPTRIVKNNESASFTSIKSGRCYGFYDRQAGSQNYDGSVRVGIAVQADGTNTYIYLHTGTQGLMDTIQRRYYDWGGTERSTSSVLTEVYRIPNVSCTQFAMAASLQTQNLGSDAVLFQYEDPTTTANGNSGPSWTNAANVTANSISTMQAFASTTARYGKQYRIRTQTSDQEIFDSNITCHFHIRLRRSPVSSAGYWERDFRFNLKCHHEVDNT